MRMSSSRFLLLLLPGLLVQSIQAQDAVFAEQELRDGLYSDHRAFRSNRPTMPLHQLRDAQGQHVTDVRRATNSLLWRPDTGETRTVDLRKVWGFCQNGVVYIGTRDGFYRIGLMGTLSHLVVEQSYRDWDPYLYGSGMGATTRTVLVQMLLDVETGALLPFNASGLDQVLVRDAVLSEEFRSLPKKRRNGPEALFRFLHLYNDRHPLIFPD